MADTGETIRFSSDLRDAPVENGGVLSNAVTAALTITLPDGTTTSPTVANPPAVTGKYIADYTPTQTGRHQGTWLFTMSGGKTTSYVETFDVGASLVTVDEAVSHLRAAGIVTSAADLEQLQWLCFVATDAVERDLGRTIVRRTISETYDGGSGALILRNTPVISVTSLVEAGVTLGVGDYLLDSSSGILYRGTSTYAAAFYSGRQLVVVTYVAGYTNPPPVVRKVALNLIQAMWEESQQASHPLIDEGNAESFSPSVAALLTPIELSAYESMRAVGVA